MPAISMLSPTPAFFAMEAPFGGPMFAVAVNMATVIVGGVAGVAIGDRLPSRMRTTILDALGLGTLVIGARMALGSQNLLLAIGSLLLGAIAGTALDLEGRMEAGAEKLKRIARSDSPTFVAGFISASLLFCVGPMTFLGSIQNGMGDPELLLIKSLLDGFAALALASAMGVGVLFASLTILAVQGGLSFAGAGAAAFPASAAGVEFNAVGGVIILAIGLGLLNIKKMPVGNLLPALLFVFPLAWLAQRLG
ncbi:MAG: putative membrane protein YdfK [candidate division BRC1 bacterium ADurb.BinA364]|nr:MAG: putative membrane protein YdfK [candidate division BRC1 bacterium ADurb.BinA364]